MQRVATFAVLETPRLRLRSLQIEDAESLTALLQDPVIARWTASIPWPYTIEDARSFISMKMAEQDLPTGYVWGIIDKSSNVIMGTVGLHDPNFVRGRAELGYWIGEEFRGHGYTTEAARRVLSWAFEDAGFERIQATYLPGNDASAGVMRNIGMQQEGVLRGYGSKNDQPVDLVLNAVLRTDTTWSSTATQMGTL